MRRHTTLGLLAAACTSLALLLAGCDQGGGPQPEVSTPHEVLSPGAAARDADRVVVVRNEDSPVSRAVANDYCRRRAVANLVTVHCPDSATSAERETISFADYQQAIKQPLRAFLADHPQVDFIVLTKGVPIRIKNAPGHGADGHRPALDSYLAALDYERIKDAILIHVKDGDFTGVAWANRFWDSQVPFAHARFGGYLVTRLDGYTQADAEALTTRALEAEQAPPTGSILLDTCPGFGYADKRRQPAAQLKQPVVAGQGIEIGELNYNEYNADMQNAADLLTARQLPVELDLGDRFLGDRTGLMGYISWGSNDRHYDPAAYHQLRFAPGSLCETAVSTSARTFLLTRGGQSLIADLVTQGATGVKGYTDEPLLQAIASPTILFDRYTHGWTLAESFYAASRFVGWEDIVIGDPLCRAYAPKGQAGKPQRP
jgi:uncharacterized protein (TIGR03790 family)